MNEQRATLPNRLTLGVKVHPRSFEHDTHSWPEKPHVGLVSAHFDIAGTRYDLTITERDVVSTQLNQSQMMRDSQGGGHHDREFTLTIWGWSHYSLSLQFNPNPSSAGLSYRWNQRDVIHWRVFADQLHISQGDAVALLKMLRTSGHKVSLPKEVDDA